MTYPTVNDHNMKWVSIEPALHGLTNGADLIQGGSVQVRPTCVKCLWDQIREGSCHRRMFHSPQVSVGNWLPQSVQSKPELCERFMGLNLSNKGVTFLCIN